MKNPFYTAILIVLIIVLIVLYVFRNVDFDDEDESLGKLVFRSSIYMLIIITAVQFLNNQIWLDDKKSDKFDAGVKKVFGGVDKLSQSSSSVLVKPKITDFTDTGRGVVNFNISPGEVSTDLLESYANDETVGDE